MKILLNDPPGCDWRISEAHCGIDSMNSIDYGMPQPLPSFGRSLVKNCFALVNRKSPTNGPVAQQRRLCFVQGINFTTSKIVELIPAANLKSIPIESGVIATFCKELPPFPKKSIIRKKQGLESFDFCITICFCTDNQDQDRFERTKE